MQLTLTRTLKWVSIALGSIVVGVPLLLIVINAFDQVLKPEAVTFADLSYDDVPDEQNGYYAWVGLAAPIGEKPHALGVKVVAQVNKQLESGNFIPTGETALLLENSAQKIKVEGSVFQLCKRDSNDCLARYRDKANDIKAWVQKNKTILARYQALYNYPQFRETILPRLKMPMFSEPARAGALRQAQLALTAIDGNPSSAIRYLQRDSAFWRLILEQSRSLINRMIAVAMIRRDAQLISEIVRFYPADLATLHYAADSVHPLTKAGLDLAKVFRYEFAFGMHTFNELRQYSHESKTDCPYDSWLYCIPFTSFGELLLKPNATNNLGYVMFSRAVERNRLAAPDFVRTFREWQELDTERPEWPWCWHCAYNLSGKFFAAQATFYDRYTIRLHNLDGFLRLVSLQVTAKRTGVRDSDMEKFLTDTASAFRNPYTNEPMDWDPTSRTIYFNGYKEDVDDELLGMRIVVRL